MSKARYLCLVPPFWYKFLAKIFNCIRYQTCLAFLSFSLLHVSAATHEMIKIWIKKSPSSTFLLKSGRTPPRGMFYIHPRRFSTAQVAPRMVQRRPKRLPKRLLGVLGRAWPTKKRSQKRHKMHPRCTQEAKEDRKKYFYRTGPWGTRRQALFWLRFWIDL